MNDKQRIETLKSAGVNLVLGVTKPVKQAGVDVMKGPELSVTAGYRRDEKQSYPSKAV